ncbi:hypothetical protein Lal_00033990 [Lupinus albus]|nr:hypothetical protein Lal_00033990 [Lupinus albus]
MDSSINSTKLFSISGNKSRSDPSMTSLVPRSDLSKRVTIVGKSLNFNDIRGKATNRKATLRNKGICAETQFVAKSKLPIMAEQRAREESERLRIEEREQIAEKRRRDLTLRARVAAKTEEKKLELLFLQWSEHHKKLSNFISIICERRPLGTTRKICVKSPPKTTTFPPNKIELFIVVPIMSPRHLSYASKQNLCVIGASYHIINNFVCFNKSTSSDP